MKIHNIQITGSSGISGNQSITGSLTVTGDIIAQQYVVSSSVVHLTQSFASGSHVFGNSSDDTHQFTGSVLVTGSLNVNNGVITLPDSIHTSAQINFRNVVSESELFKFPAANNTITKYGATDKLYYKTDKSVSNQDILAMTTDGFVGIGTTSPSQKLEVVGGEIKAGRVDTTNEGGQVSFGRASDNNTAWYIDAYGNVASPQLRFVNVSDSLVAMTITGSRVGVGTSTPNAPLQISSATGTNVNPAVNITNTTLNGYGILRLTGNSRGGFIDFYDNSSAQASIVGQGGAFYVYTNGDSSGTPKLSITTGGSVAIGTESPLAKLTVVVSSSSAEPTLMLNQGAAYANIAGAGDQYHGLILRGYPAAAGDYSVTANDSLSFYEYGADFRFYKKQPGVLTQQVRFTEGVIYATNTSVQSISDIRTKENITNSEQGLDVITALRPVRFDFKEEFNEGRKNQLGFIAQEVEEIFPDAVGEWKDDNDEINYKTVGPGALIPVLVKAIQEQQELIQSLQSRLDTLENA
jgi:hypothetical protein